MSIRKALLGWHLVTAKITYYMPDHPHVINPHWFLWQHDDRAPDYPRLHQFLGWWDQNIEAKLHAVVVSTQGLIEPREFKHYGAEFRLS